MSHVWTNICSIVFMFVGLLLIFVILLQRGRGGGLAGAFGGAGGQSAFGTKAGDVFTRITIVIAIIWVALAGVTGYAMRYESETGRRFQSPVADKDASKEGNLEPKTGAADQENPFEAGSQDKTPATDKGKSASTSQKSSPKAADKTAPATKAAPATPPAKTKQ
jgi:preprotein translocase subunit SecG